MTDLTARKQALMAYARSCLEAGDWRGCRDACADLEVIEARIQERGRSDARYTLPEDPDPTGKGQHGWMGEMVQRMCG